MIRWCSYCQKFLGESKPYDSFEVTDGICRSCTSKSAKFLDQHVVSQNFLMIKDLFQSLRLSAKKGEFLNPQEVMSKAKSIGVSESDVLVGMAQPILMEIGDLFARGEFDISHEHMFSSFVEKFLSHFEYTPVGDIDVLLVCAEGNYHSIGIRVLNIILNKNGISSCVIYPGFPLKTLEKTIENLNPYILGVSIAQDKEVEYLNRVYELFNEKVSCFLCGGGVLKDDSSAISGKWELANPRSVDLTVKMISELLEKSKLDKVG